MSGMPTAGLTAIAVTPLHDDGTLDRGGIGPLMDFYVRAGSAGIAILGVMGEAHRMTDSETRLVVDSTVDAVATRVPIIVGVSNPSLSRVVELAHHAMGAGCAGVLLQPTPGLQGDAAVAAYFEQAAAALGPEVPICVQDFPKANGVHLSVDAWRRIVESSPSVVMLKAEDEPGLGKLTAIRRAESDGVRRVTILTGNNGIQLPQELGRGADGAMTGFAFPDVLARMIDLHRAGSTDDAEDLFDAYLPVNRYELRMGIAMRKEILRRRGALASAACRHPVGPLDPVTVAELDQLLARLETATAPIADFSNRLMDLVVRNGRVVTGGRVEDLDIGVADGLIVALGARTRAGRHRPRWRRSARHGPEGSTAMCTWANDRRWAI